LNHERTTNISAYQCLAYFSVATRFVIKMTLSLLYWTWQLCLLTALRSSTLSEETSFRGNFCLNSFRDMLMRRKIMVLVTFDQRLCYIVALHSVCTDVRHLCLKSRWPSVQTYWKWTALRFVGNHQDKVTWVTHLVVCGNSWSIPLGPTVQT